MGSLLGEISFLNFVYFSFYWEYININFLFFSIRLFFLFFKERRFIWYWGVYGGGVFFENGLGFDVCLWKRGSREE